MSDSFEEIFETLSPRLSAQLDALGFQGCAAEREDLLQEIRIRIWKTFKNGRRGISNVNAYIKKIVYSVFINEMSRQKRDRQLVCLAGEAFISHTNNCSEGFFIHALQIDEIRNCIRALRPATRRVVELSLEGMKLAEIARLYEWSYRTTCLRYYRGVKELKRRLRVKGIQCED